MRFQATHHYPAGPDRVATMFADDAYLRAAAQGSGALTSRHEVAGAPPGPFTVSATRRLPASSIPASMRSLVGSAIEVKMVQVWSEARDDGARTATVTLDVTGAPARSTARIRLHGSDEGTTVEHEWQVQAAIPLLGPAVEQAIGQAVRTALDAEHRCGLDHLAAG